MDTDNIRSGSGPCDEIGDTMNTAVDKQEITEARLRSRVYSLLSEGFSILNDEIFELLRSGHIETWREIARSVNGGEKLMPLIEKLEGTINSISKEDLAAEHSRLFEPGSKLLVPPYETEYTLSVTPQHALSQTAHLADIAGFYKAFGLMVSDDMPDRADNVVTELEFMSYMAYKESIAVEAHETENAGIVRDAETKFLNDHLGCWTGQFRDRISVSDELGFYITLAGLLDIWVGHDRDYLNAYAL